MKEFLEKLKQGNLLQMGISRTNPTGSIEIDRHADLEALVNKELVIILP
jgi:hypothetical protein